MHNMHSCTHAFHKKKKRQANSFFHIIRVNYHTFICLYQDPLRWNGHWFSCVFILRPSAKQWSSIFHIKTLYDGMVIDFHMLSYRGPLQKQWSSIFHIKTLCKSNGRRSFISRPSTKPMVIDLSYRGPLQSNGHRSFISRPSSMVWSLIFMCFHIEALCKAMVIDLSYGGPLQQWSSIFYIKTLFDGMVIDFYMLSYRGPLQKPWSSIFHIKTLCKGNGHWSFILRPSVTS